MIQAIKRAEEKKNPGEIFVSLPENLIWSNARSIFDNPELSDYGPTLLQSIDEAFTSMNERDAACDLLLHILTSTTDKLIYGSAQHAVLHHSNMLEKKFVRQVYSLFESSYQYHKDGGDIFIAQLSLEGAVLLPVFRAEHGLLHRAISLLIEDFPPIPEEPSNAAYLPVKAVKLLGRCYDCVPKDSAIIQKIQECVQCSNYAVSTEARFVSGIISLYEAFSASDESTFLSTLDDAARHFNAAAVSEEKRTDAELLAAITRCYILLLKSASSREIREVVSYAEEVLAERLLVFGGLDTTEANIVEFRLVQMLTYLARWAETLSASTRWTDLRPPLRVLADIYTAVREFDVSQPFFSKISKSTQAFVMLPYLHGRFVQIQEITSKIITIVSDMNWRELATPSEIAFYELILQMLQDTPSPKEWAATELEKVRMAAEKDDPALAEFISTFQQSGEDFSAGFVQLAWHYLQQERLAFSTENPLSEGPAKEICERIIPYLRETLSWDVHSLRWKFLVYAVRLTILYLIRVYRITPGEAAPEDVSFLFAEGIEGLNGRGQKAVEKDLENHFYRNIYMSNLFGGIERQSKSIAPGIPDLNFRFPGDIVFPIEVKREFKDISRANIQERYMTQSQSYAAAIHGVGFLFILDLTPKPLQTPLRDVVDCCYVDHRPVPDSTRKDLVVVVLFPANRPRPSDHSWKTPKRRKAI